MKITPTERRSSSAPKPRRAASQNVCAMFLQAEHGIRDAAVTGVQTCALPICFFFQAEDGIRDATVTGVQTCVFFQAEDGIRDATVTGVQTCALPISIEAAKDGPVKVGSLEKGKSPYGVYDMSGNVWEWVDAWDSKKQYRIMRGGSYFDGEDMNKTISTLMSIPDDIHGYIGFRCVK